MRVLSTSSSKFVLRLVIFFLVLDIIIAGAMFIAYTIDDDVNDIKSLWQDIYATEPDCVDIVFLGSSHANSTFDPKVFDDVIGKVSFNLGSSNQTPKTSYYILKEFLKKQHPRILVQEVYWDVLTNKVEETAVNSQQLLYMHPGTNWLGIYANAFSEKERETFIIKGLNPFYRLKGIALRHLTARPPAVEQTQPSVQYKGRGYRPYLITADGSRKGEVIKRLNGFTGYSSEQLQYLQKTLDLAKSRDMKIILVMAPIMPEVFDSLNCYNNVEQVTTQIARNNNVDYIDFNRLIQKKGIFLPTSYFGDEHHVNEKGAQVVSTYVAEYIKSNRFGNNIPTKSRQLSDYDLLLDQFPKDNQGLGSEPSSATISHQPMTYGLILSAESLHYLKDPNRESEYRIKRAVRWILDNADLNHDSYYGWGLPQAWDAFADGTTNPENHPYTITTAIVLQGLTDALSISSFWTENEKQEIQRIIKNVCLYWCEEVWTGKGNSGYFWYSISSSDACFCPNVSAMFLGVLARITSEQKQIFTNSELYLIQNRVDKAAKGIISNVKWSSGMPFWNYTIQNDVSPNDLVHHAFILWGMELYRYSGGQIEIPWSQSQAIASLNRFWKDGIIYELPKGISYNKNNSTLKNRPARLWGIGMLQAFYCKYGESEKSNLCLEVIKKEYGFPRPRIYPRDFNQDDQFYPRYGAYVLYGMAQDFRSKK